MNLHSFIDLLYSAFPFIYNLQLNFFNGNHFKLLKTKLGTIQTDSIFEIGCGTAPILKEFKPSTYTGVDIDTKFIDLARKIYNKNKNYQFYTGDGRTISLKKEYDIILFSHTTHHLTDKDIKKILKKITKYKFKHLVIYDGRPRGLFTPILLRLDYDAAKFRNVKDFVPLVKEQYVIKHMETFRSNRPFYEYQLLIASKKKTA